MTNTTGGCACGAIRYELTAEPMGQVACHCRACQYAAGGSPTLAMIVPKAALSITKGAPRTYWSLGDNGAKVGRSFCETCGSPVFSEPASAEIAVVKVGSLDDPSQFTPQVHIWTSAAQPWHHIDASVPTFAKQFGE
jgi:hypothetical protein